MTEDEKRNMLQSVLDGDKWEYRKKGYATVSVNGVSNSVSCPSDWFPYKLGDAIDDSCEYRKVYWTVCIGTAGDFLGIFRLMSNADYNKSTLWWKKVFSGTKKECNDYIYENIRYVTENQNKLVIVDRDKIIKWYSDVDSEYVLFKGSKEACEEFIKNYKDWQVLEYKGDLPYTYDKYIYARCDVPVKDYYHIVYVCKSKAACEDWIKEHNTWVDNNYPVREDYPFDDWDRGLYAQNVISEFAREFLSRIDNDNIALYSAETIRQILIDMGVKNDQ